MMKAYIIIITSILLTGCTHNILISDFESSEEYYNTLNNIVENRKVKVDTRDSSFTLEDIVVNEKILTGKFFPLDTSRFSYFSYIPPEEIPVILPTDQIKSISVTKRPSAILKGVGIGAISGALWGAFFVDMGGGSNSGHHPDYYVGAITTSLAGAAVGGILGLIVGDDYVFSPYQLSRNELFGDNSVHKLGIKLGRHSGFDMTTLPKEGRSGGSVDGTGSPGFSVTLYYNYILGKNFSLSNELTFVSAASYERYSLYINHPENSYNNVTGQSTEKLKVIEAAPLIRLNLFKGGFTAYFFIGPKLSIQFPPESSAKEKYFNDVNNQYGSNEFWISGAYETVVWSGIIGAGLSTGKLFPYEILVEVKYSKDISGRFKLDYYDANWFHQYYYNTQGDSEHAADEITINIGVGVF